MVRAIVKTKDEARSFIINNNPNRSPAHTIEHIVDRIKNFPSWIAYCADERTGRRFGNALARKNKSPLKIGSGGRNKGNISWQCWIWDTDEK